MLVRRVRVVDRNELVQRIMMASMVRLYDEAKIHMLLLVTKYGKQLTKEERNLFAVFYKERLAKPRKDYQVFIELKRKIRCTEVVRRRVLHEFLCRTRFEVVSICEEVILAIDTDILGTKDFETEVYFLKLRGDYYRYWAEVSKEDQWVFGYADLRAKAENSYKEGLALANRKLQKHHPLRLGLMLNMSILYYEVPCQRILALQTAMQAMTEGKAKVNEDPEIPIVIKVLKDNLDIWMSNLGTEEIIELERLEGARKWFGKEAAVPSDRLIRQLSGKSPPKLIVAEAVRQRHHTTPSIPQPYFVPSLVRYEELEPYYVYNHYPFLHRDFPHIYKSICEVTQQSAGPEAQDTITESQYIRAATTTSTTTSSAVTASAAPNTHPIAAYWDPDSRSLPQTASAFLPASRKLPSEDEQLSAPDLFEGVLQPTLNSSTSATTSSTQSQDDDAGEGDDDWDNFEQMPFYRTAVPKSSEPCNIPRTNIARLASLKEHQHSMFSRSGLVRRLRGFEHRMRAIRECERQVGQIPHHPNEGRITRSSEEQGDSDSELFKSTYRAIVVETETPITQTSPKITTAATLPSPLHNVSKYGKTVGDSISRQLHSQLVDSPFQPNYTTKLQHQYATNFPTPLNTTTTPSPRHRHFTLGSKRVVCSASGQDFLPQNLQMSDQLQSGSKVIGNPSFKGAVAGVISLPHSKSFCKTTLPEKSHNLPYSRSRRARPSHLPTEAAVSREPSGSLFSWSSPSKTNIPSGLQSDRNLLRNDQKADPSQTKNQQSTDRQQSSKKNQKGNLLQHRLLRRSFSTPRSGAPWPMSSLAREPAYYVNRVLRRASAPDRAQLFGRRFLSAHSSAEELYDEAADKTSDPWSPRGTRTMRNTFPIEPWNPREPPRVPWIRF